MNNLSPKFGKPGRPDDPIVVSGDFFYIRYRMGEFGSTFDSGTEMMFFKKFRDRNDLMGIVGSELSLFFKKGFR